jgi:hypothetical protein
VYADITLEAGALDIPNNVQFFSQMPQLNTHQRSILNQTSLPFSSSFTWTVTQHNH